MPTCGSPKLFAAYRVLHRQSVPWHPPCALIRLILPRSILLPKTCSSLDSLDRSMKPFVLLSQLGFSRSPLGSRSLSLTSTGCFDFTSSFLLLLPCAVFKVRRVCSSALQVLSSFGRLLCLPNKIYSLASSHSLSLKVLHLFRSFKTIQCFNQVFLQSVLSL